MTPTIVRLMREQAPVLGDGGYLIELERRGYVDSGSGREKVGTGRGSGQFTPEVVVEHPDALRELHREFLDSGSRVLQALTFFATREKLSRAGYGNETEAINVAAVRLAKEVAGERALVAGSVSRTQLFEREGPGSAGHVRDLFEEQIRLLKDAGVDFLILETFFHLEEMVIALGCARASGLEVLATMSFRPTLAVSSDGYSPEQCAKQMAESGAAAVGANCEQEPARIVPLVKAMGAAAASRSRRSRRRFARTRRPRASRRCPSFRINSKPYKSRAGSSRISVGLPQRMGSASSADAAVAMRRTFARWRPASGSLSRLADTHGQHARGRRLTNSNPPRLLQDIQSQPESLAGILSYQLGSGYEPLVRAAGTLRAATRVVITGMGASMFASIPFEYRLCSVGIDATVVESGELLHYPRPLLRDTVVVVVSRSGESVEIAKLLPVLRGTCTTIGVTNDPESSLARGTDQALYIRSPPDEMVAIQTYAGTVLVLALVAAAVADELPAAASEARAALDLQRSFVREGVERLTLWDEFLESRAPIYLLARGPSSSSAFEGALLFNETAKVPAIGMTAASFRHGPVELVDGNFAGLIFAPADGTRMLNLALAEDLVRFGGRVRVIGPPHPDHSSLDWCETPEVPAFLARLFEVIPVQLAALRLAQLRGIAVGQFRYAPQVSRDEATFAPPG